MGSKSKKPDADKDWSRMRDKVVPRHLRKPVDALEAVINDLEPLLDPRARRHMSHVARVRSEPSGRDRAAAFEDIIDKADAVIRQVRIQQGLSKEDYETPILKPLLGTLSTTQSVETELRKRQIPLSRASLATSERQRCVDSIHHRTKEHADWLDNSVNADTLWNAYRLDFKGRGKDNMGRDKEWLTPAQWKENLFIQNMPATTEALRPIVQARAMQKLARKLVDADEGQQAITRAIEKFMAKLPPHHQLHSPEVTQWIAILKDPATSPMQQLITRRDMASQLQEAAYYVLAKQEDDKGVSLRKRLVQAYQQDKEAFYKKFLLPEEEQIGLFEDEAARAKRTAEIEALKDEAFTKVLDSAPHLRDKISAARGAALLHSFEPILYMHWQAVEAMYPYQSPAKGEGAARLVAGDGSKGRTGGVGS